jgi:hypothetical protein
MKIGKRDWIFAGIILAVLLFFIAISSEEKTKTTPMNPTHQQVYDVAFKNAPGPDASIFKRFLFKPDKKGAEKLCEPCHLSNNVPFPPNHPPKNRCLFCHKLKN